jgi:hypothetical protein
MTRRSFERYDQLADKNTSGTLSVFYVVVFVDALQHPACSCYNNRVMKVTVDMPDQVARQWGETPDAVGRHVIEDAAIEGYRSGRLSHRQVGELLGFDYWQTDSFFKERGVPVNYSPADLDADNETLNRILARP